MENNTEKNKENTKDTGTYSTSDYPGYPHYPASEDITNPENDTQELHLDDEGNLIDDNETNDNSLDKGLDIPGSELDDADENIGEEDEENNYYSLGGDEHNNLEEDNG